MQIEDTIRLLSEILHKAVADYMKWSANPPSKSRDREHFESAKVMLWDDDYLMRWGDQEISLATICEVLGHDVVSFRRHLRKQESNGTHPHRQSHPRGQGHARRKHQDKGVS